MYAKREGKKLESEAEALEDRLKPMSAVLSLAQVVCVSCIARPFVMELNTYFRSRRWRR